MKSIFAILFMFSSLFAESITTKDVSKYVGEEKTVCGKVVSTRYAYSSFGAPTYLTFKKKNPKIVFKAVIFEDNIDNFSGSPEYTYYDEEICVTGLIEMYDDTYQMVLSSDHQIK